MDIVFYSCTTFITWVLSATILLPFVILLKYSETFQDLWFSFIFMKWIVPTFMSPMVPLRKKAFDLLNEKLIARDVTKPLKVLEIGIGSGENLKFYPVNSHLTALDVNINFHSYFEKNQKKYPHIVYERTVVSPAENMKAIEDCSMDLVISTYVLCSVKIVNDVLKEIKRVLKPGGTFLFLEHVAYPKSDWGYTLQRFASPLWDIYFDGDCLTKNTGDVIQKFGFSDVSCKIVCPRSVNVVVRHQLYGLATK